MSEGHVENILTEILAELKSIKNQHRQWLNIGELSDYIGVKISTIYQYVNRGQIPFKKIPGGSKLIFSRDEIDNWIKNGNHDNVTNVKAKIEADRIWDEIRDKNN